MTLLTIAATAFVAYAMEAVQQICAVRGEEIKERIQHVYDNTSFTSPYAPYLVTLKEDTYDEAWGTQGHYSLKDLMKIYFTEGQRYTLQAKEKAGGLPEGDVT